MTQIKHIAELSAEQQEVLHKARTNFIQAKTAENLSIEMKAAGKELAEPVLSALGVDCVTFSDGYKLYRRPESRTTYAEKAIKEAMLAKGIDPTTIMAVLAESASKSEFVKVYGQESRAGGGEDK
jgi:hypothetical protein